jgi:hypothetical protein
MRLSAKRDAAVASTPTRGSRRPRVPRRDERKAPSAGRRQRQACRTVQRSPTTGENGGHSRIHRDHPVFGERVAERSAHRLADQRRHVGIELPNGIHQRRPYTLRSRVRARVQRHVRFIVLEEWQVYPRPHRTSHIGVTEVGVIPTTSTRLRPIMYTRSTRLAIACPSGQSRCAGASLTIATRGALGLSLSVRPQSPDRLRLGWCRRGRESSGREYPQMTLRSNSSRDSSSLSLPQDGSSRTPSREQESRQGRHYRARVDHRSWVRAKLVQLDPLPYVCLE